MSMFDFFFPEQAEAMHLRDISEQMRVRRVHEEHDSRRSRRQEENLGALEGRLRSLETRVHELEDENAVLGLLTMSLIKVLAEKNSITMKDVFDQVKAVDALDGKADGKVDLSALRMMFGLEVGSSEETETAPDPTADWECPSCHHMNAAARRWCLYCDTQRPS